MRKTNLAPRGAIALAHCVRIVGSQLVCGREHAETPTPDLDSVTSHVIIDMPKATAGGKSNQLTPRFPRHYRGNAITELTNFGIIDKTKSRPPK
jgi:hypothetical protein